MEGRFDDSDGAPPSSGLDARAEALRYRTLTRLEEILRVLTERHGARVTVGELFAIYAAMSRLCRKDRISIGEIAEVTGLPKQNISRWARKRIGDSISLRVNEHDQRRHDVIMMDATRGQENIERLAEILGITVEDN